MTWVALLLLVSLQAQAGSNWKFFLARLPKEVRTCLTKLRICQQFGGDQISPCDQKRFEDLKCERNEQQLEVIHAKYAGNSRVQSAIACSEERVNAVNCPSD